MQLSKTCANKSVLLFLLFSSTLKHSQSNQIEHAVSANHLEFNFFFFLFAFLSPFNQVLSCGFRKRKRKRQNKSMFAANNAIGNIKRE